MLNKPETYWNNVLFTDENKFIIFGSDGRIAVWRRKNEENHSKNLVGTVKHGGGDVLVWRCISASGLRNLIFVDGIMNHSLYLNILRDNLKLSAKNLGETTLFFFIMITILSIGLSTFVCGVFIIVHKLWKHHFSRHI